MSQTLYAYLERLSGRCDSAVHVPNNTSNGVFKGTVMRTNGITWERGHCPHDRRFTHIQLPTDWSLRYYEGRVIIVDAHDNERYALVEHLGPSNTCMLVITGS